MYLNKKKEIEDGGGTTLSICLFLLNIARMLFNIEYQKDRPEVKLVFCIRLYSLPRTKLPETIRFLCLKWMKVRIK